MTDSTGGLRGLLKRCSMATNTAEVWFAVGITLLVLGLARPSGGFVGLGAAFLAIGIARKRRPPSS